MSPERHFRSGRNGQLWIRALLACAALLAVLAARNVPPDFPTAPCIRSSVGAALHHDQRPRFDNSGLKWTLPAAKFLLALVIAESTQVALAPPLCSPLQTKGFHFSRP